MCHADVPLKKRTCPGLEKCPWKQEGPEPCESCEIKKNISWVPRHQTTQYANLLASYIETFSVSPDKLSWYDFEIHQAYLTAKSEHEEQKRKRIEDGGKS